MKATFVTSKLVSSIAIAAAMLLNACGTAATLSQVAATSNGAPTLSCDGGVMTVSRISQEGGRAFDRAIIHDEGIVDYFKSKGVVAKNDKIVLDSDPYNRTGLLPLAQLAGAGSVPQSIEQGRRIDAYVFNDFTGVKVKFEIQRETQTECHLGGHYVGEGTCFTTTGSCGEGGGPGCTTSFYYSGRSVEVTRSAELANWYFQRCESI